MEGLQIQSAQNKTDEYRENGIIYVDRMADGRVTKRLLQYTPKGRGDRVRPWKRWNGTVKPEQASAVSACH
jgi:hypothetical protein